MSTTCLKCKKPLPSKNAHYGLHTTCFKTWLEIKSLDEFNNILRQPTDSEGEPWNSSFFQGKFRKYSATLGKHDYILKVEIPEAPELADVEFLCNQIGEEIGINIPKYYLIQFENLRCFVSRNFITKSKRSSTLNHMYHFIKSSNEYDCETIINIIKEKTLRFHNIANFVHLCLYDALIGNHDRHGRNLGFINTASSDSLSLVYDNTSALGLESGNMLKAQFNPRGKILTHISNEPTMTDYVKEFQHLDYSELVSSFKKRIKIENINLLIKESTCSELMKEALLRLIHLRYQELENALSD